MRASLQCHFLETICIKDVNSSVLVDQNLFFIKDSFEKFLSASQLMIGIVKYSLSTVVILGSTSIRFCSQIS